MGDAAKALIKAAEGRALTPRVLAESRVYPNISSPEKAAVVIQKARGLRLDVTTVADNLFFINGKPSWSGQIIASQIRRSGRYDYRVVEKTDKRARIRFMMKNDDGKWETLGTEEYTYADAEAAGDTQKKGSQYLIRPATMLYWRCLTQGARIHCPDVMSGSPIYTADELDTSLGLDDEGQVVQLEVTGNKIGPERAQALRELIQKAGADEGAVAANYKVASLEDLSNDAAEAATKILNARLDSIVPREAEPIVAESAGGEDKQDSGNDS